MKFYNSTENFRKLNNNSDFIFNKDNFIKSIEVIKEEYFGFFITIVVPEYSCININKDNSLPWWGHNNRYRVEVDCNIPIKTYLTDTIKNEKNELTTDILLNSTSFNYNKGVVPIYVEGKIPKEFSHDSVDITVKLYRNSQYKIEQLIDCESLTINVLNYELKNNDFFLDLWQHPCSWARTYDVEYFSDEHFVIIENFLAELAKLGQKVITLVVSDYPWAGQKCFSVKDNPSRLYEYNIIKVKKKNNELILDFTHLDKYINLCYKVGIKEEINLFGLIGNWHGFDFGSPLTDYEDPIRISYYDEDKGVFDYIRTKSELKIYIQQVFNHFFKNNYLKITKVIGDEPFPKEKFDNFSKFLQSCTTHNITYKYAILHHEFFEQYDGAMNSFSLHSSVVANFCEEGRLTEKLNSHAKQLTWYPCCFPEKLNTFLHSPLIESRLLGIYTYLFKMKGMLRWAYGLYPENIFLNANYKPEKWPVGDMFLVYPGKNLKPLHSLRERNMLYSIQDFNIFKQLEKNIPNLYELLYTKLEIKKLISYKENFQINLDNYPNINDYKKTRNSLIKSLLND